MTTDDLATRLMALINSKPSSPRKEEILAVLAQSAPPTQSLSYKVMPLHIMGAELPCVRVEPSGRITVHGWHMTSLEPEDRLVAVVDWLRDMALMQRGC
jgi:hypothetical protein